MTNTNQPHKEDGFREGGQQDDRDRRKPGQDDERNRDSKRQDDAREGQQRSGERMPDRDRTTGGRP